MTPRYMKSNYRRLTLCRKHDTILFGLFVVAYVGMTEMRDFVNRFYLSI